MMPNRTPNPPPHPPIQWQSPPESFDTISPALASALIAAGALSYSHAKLHSNGRDVVYTFADPARAGDELQRRYAVGAFPLVHAKVLAEARTFLADEAARVRNARH